MYSYRDFLLLNFIENNLCRGFPFWAVKCGTKLFPRVYVTFRQGLKSCHVGSFEDQNKQLTFQLALGVLIIKHNIHMFNVLVQISRFIVAIQLMDFFRCSSRFDCRGYIGRVDSFFSVPSSCCFPFKNGAKAISKNEVLMWEYVCYLLLLNQVKQIDVLDTGNDLVT